MSIFKAGPNARTTEHFTYCSDCFSLPYPAAFHPHHGYDLSSRIFRHGTSLKKMAPPWIYMSFHVVMFSFSPSPSFSVTTLIFRITTLTIPYDSDDCHARVHLYHFLSPSETGCYYELVYVCTILSLITWNVIWRQVRQLPYALDHVSTNKQV
jgi:hypothetical protein